MGTVKYSGPVASFHCPTEATIRSLKVHFSPKQLGSGDPSPENIREIVGWDGVEAYNYIASQLINVKQTTRGTLEGTFKTDTTFYGSPLEKNPPEWYKK